MVLPLPSSAQGKPRIVLLCCDGLYQRHLAVRIAGEFDLVGVVRHRTPNAKGSLASRLAKLRQPIAVLRHLNARLRLSAYERQARETISELFLRGQPQPRFPPNVPLIDVGNINDDLAVDFVRRLAPDALCINGTNLLREPMLRLIPNLRYGAINLHTGLSPYSRGGNCNMFMLLEGRVDLIGVTIHHIDAGVDSGDIILTGRPRLDPDDNYETIDAKTFKLGIDLMVQAIRQLHEGRAQRVKQWTEGKVFLKRTGYEYTPSLRAEANRLAGNGMVREYLERRTRTIDDVRLIGQFE